MVLGFIGGIGVGVLVVWYVDLRVSVFGKYMWLKEIFRRMSRGEDVCIFLELVDVRDYFFKFKFWVGEDMMILIQDLNRVFQGDLSVLVLLIFGFLKVYLDVKMKWKEFMSEIQKIFYEF